MTGRERVCQQRAMRLLAGRQESRGETSTELDDKVAFPADELVLVQGGTTSEIPSALLSLASKERRETKPVLSGRDSCRSRAGGWPDPVCMLLRGHERPFP